MGSDEIKEKLKIVIVEPRFSFNLGLILRAMTNFGFKNIVLINPRCKLDSEKLKQFSMKGSELIKEIKVYESLKKLKEEGNFLIGTTRVSGRYRSKRYSPEEVKDLININNSPALVFGNEERGLNRKELRLVDALSTIKTEEGENGSINLSTAVSIYLYEISKEKNLIYKSADKEKINHFYQFILKKIKERKILKENHYKHPEGIILNLIKRAKIKEEEIGFLYYIAKKVL